MIIGKNFLPLQPNFVIPISELVSGSCTRSWHADGMFFDGFENSEILDASLSVEAHILRGKDSVKACLSAKGTVTVKCDRCLADLDLPVDVTDTEDITLAADATAVDLSQTLYDFVCTALPMVRCHAQGKCDPDTVRFLSKGVPAPAQEELSDNPFSALKDILKGK